MPSKTPSSQKKSTPVKPLSSNTEGLTLLGKTGIPTATAPSLDLLETFPNPSPNRIYEISFTTEEFTSMCPVTGQPDFATIEISYIPNERCIESKGLKLYLHTFRNQGAFGEAIVNRILDDLVAVLKPQSALVIGDFTPRGGIGLSVEASYFEEKKAKKKKK